MSIVCCYEISLLARDAGCFSSAKHLKQEFNKLDYSIKIDIVEALIDLEKASIKTHESLKTKKTQDKRFLLFNSIKSKVLTTCKSLNDKWTTNVPPDRKRVARKMLHALLFNFLRALTLSKDLSLTSYPKRLAKKGVNIR